ncbi:MAG: alpha/beta hydrolase domain-containing protein [Vicinamibacteria bacterium]
MRHATLVLASASLGLALVAARAEARVVRLDVRSREVVAGGRPFGPAGAYEKLAGTVEIALVPARRQNRPIVDLELAPRDGRGEVTFTADFYVLKPVDLSRGNGRLYAEVPNRGGKGLLSRLQFADGSLDPSTAADFGDGWLLRQGFSLAWIGWQWDVPERPGLLRLRAPVATEAGRAITGLVRAVVLVDARQDTAPLGDRGHTAYPAVDPDGVESALYVRDHALDAPRLVPRSSWRFADPTTVALDGGFAPGRIYEVVYRSRDPRVAGCGFAATRDVVSFFKHARGPGNPLDGVRLAIAHGVSQSGRFLRHFLYEGFNEDEAGRRVFDGVFVDVAGAGRGDFDRRFAQPSRDGHQHWNPHYATDAFPFTDLPQTDPSTGERRGLLDRAIATGTVPKLVHSFGAYEYWNRAASLVTTDAAGEKDVPLPATSRAYAIASVQHGPGRLPPAEARRDGLLATNPIDYRPALRSLVHALDLWVADGVEPPPSLYPRVEDGTLAPPERAGWPELPGVLFPTVRNEPPRLDFGPRWARGVSTVEPPRLGPVFRALVPAVDPDGNDRAGIRLPEVAVPLETQTGWNWRAPEKGAADALAPYVGGSIPFARTRAEREAAGDPRPSIEERYAGRDDYLARVRRAADALVAGRLLLAEDVPAVVERAARHWDWLDARGRARGAAGPTGGSF